MTDLIEKLKKFHGPDYSSEAWISIKHTQCLLCKTTSNSTKHRHWSNGLCRSCYRRLSAVHRLYNDKWTDLNQSGDDSHLKNYKTTSLEEIVFAPVDIETLLERYDFKCAYCWRELQGHDHTSLNSLNIEYLKLEAGKFELVPVCKSCNCSKKNLNEELKLKRWAKERGLKYPFFFHHPPKV